MSSWQGMSEQTGTGGLLNLFVEHHVYRVSRLIVLVGQEKKNGIAGLRQTQNSEIC